MNDAVPARVWVIPVVIAVLLQVWLALSMPAEITDDSPSYIAQAQSLVSDHSARNAAGEPDTVRTPGYPLFVAMFLATGAGLPGLVLAQRLLWIGVVAGVAAWTFQNTRHAGVSIVAAGITAVDVPALQGTGSVLTETLAAVFVSLSAWRAYVAISQRSVGACVAAGLLAGVAALVRPVAVLLGAPLALAAVAAGPRPGRTRLAAALLAASLVLPTLWTARNYFMTGVVTFSSIGSINLLLYRAAGVLAIRDPGGVDANLPRRQIELETLGCRVVEQRFGQPCASIPMTLRASVYGELAWPIIFGDPAAAAMQAARAFIMITFGGGANMLSRLTGVSESSTRLFAFGYTVPLALCAVIGAWHWWRRDRLAASLLVLTIAYMVGISLGAEAYSRFRVPILPLYAVLAATGAVAAWSAVRGRRISD